MLFLCRPVQLLQVALSPQIIKPSMQTCSNILVVLSKLVQRCSGFRKAGLHPFAGAKPRKLRAMGRAVKGDVKVVEVQVEHKLQIYKPTRDTPLGVKMQSVSVDASGNQGPTIVIELEEGSLLKAAGAQVHDRLVRIGDGPVTGALECAEQLKKAEGTFTVIVARGGSNPFGDDRI